MPGTKRLGHRPEAATPDEGDSEAWRPRGAATPMQGLSKQSVFRRGVFKQGVFERGVFRQNVFKRGVLKRGVF